MNCFSGSIFLICLFGFTACGAPASETDGGQASTSYVVHYTISPNPRDEWVHIEMFVKQTRGQLRELSFPLGDDQITNVEADGELVTANNLIRWRPERTGGSLR